MLRAHNIPRALTLVTRTPPHRQPGLFVGYHVLAIETSCDDTTVALIDRPSSPSPPRLITHVKRSLDNTKAGGIIPLDARNFHQQNLAPMVRDLFVKYNSLPRPTTTTTVDAAAAVDGGLQEETVKIDLICATRGPGMIGSLSAGYNFAKGLSVALGVPLVGVHHMVGHLLTPRFFQAPTTTVAAAAAAGSTPAGIPQYPFFSLLVSGGHTMLVRSASPTDHTVLANTVDIAVGDMLDKCARELGLTGNMLGQELEKFVNNTTTTNTTTNPAAAAGSDNNDIAARLAIVDSIQFPNPLQNKSGRAANVAAYSFAGFITALRTAVATKFPSAPTATPAATAAAALDEETRRALARRLQTAIFTHLVSKTALALRAYFEAHPDELSAAVDVVCAGGVASNLELRAMLEAELRKPPKPSKKKQSAPSAPPSAAAVEKVQPEFKFYYPAPKWCTDNALMIGWAGIEMWETARLHTDLSALPTAKWPIEEVLSIDGWLPRED